MPTTRNDMKGFVWPEHMPKPIETVWPKRAPARFRTTVQQGRYQRQIADEPNPRFSGSEEAVAGYLLGFYNPGATTEGLWRFYVAKRRSEID